MELTQHLRGEETVLLGKPLSKRETEVCVLLAHGKHNKEIAAFLGTSVGSVNEYLSRAYKKTGATSRVQLAKWWDCMEELPDSEKGDCSRCLLRVAQLFGKEEKTQ